jgi:hypothetical protein
VNKANEIQAILSKNGRSLHGFPFVVQCSKSTKVFGYRGPDIDRIDGATAINSETSGERRYPGTYGIANTYDGEMSGTQYMADTMSHERGGTHTYNGNYYNTYHIGTNMTQGDDGLHTYNGNYYNKDLGNCSDGGHQVFSNTPYWSKGSMMVEIFCGDERNGNITGAPIRIATTRRDGSAAVSLWTCGGIIRVDGIDYGLTTAHPLVLSNSARSRNPSQEKPVTEGNDMTEDLTLDNGPFGGKHEFFSAEECPEKYWQAIGKVSHYALAETGSIPGNNDWLLFDLPKDRSMWNDFGKNTKYDADALAVFTARGTLSAHMLEGTAFLMLGNSSFEVLKIGLDEPLRKHTYKKHVQYRTND